MRDNTKTIFEKMKKWSGKITATRFLIEGEEAEKLQTMLANAVEIPFSEFDKSFTKLKELCQFKEEVCYNQIVASGREVFSRRLNNELTYTGVINYGLLGTGSAAVNDADTVLDNEVKRKAVATRSRVGNTITLRFFFSKSDISGTFPEFGTVIDGTASVDTGQLFNRALTGGWVKSSLEALTVTVQFDLNAA